MTNLNVTWSEFRKLGGYPAKVPIASSHIQTVVKTKRYRTPPCFGWPDGRQITEIGPEMLEVKLTACGTRCVRFTAASDFQHLCAGPQGLLWEKKTRS